MAIEERGKVFRDPVHGLIRIDQGDDFVLSLIDAPEFQRLRRVRQLGVSSMTYPGAEHTRFAHSLGVFNFAQRMLAVLMRRYTAQAGVNDLLHENSATVKAAALLHDIGHGPFSHMIERAFDSVGDHEKTTVDLIRERGSIPNRLAEYGIDPNEVAHLILKTSEHRLLVDVISSQLDADRMDYILRDSLNTGVKYGVFDSEWVLNSLCVGLEPNPGEGSKDWRLCLDAQRGLYSAEQLVMARMHMSYQVYYHRVTRGWEAHLLCLLRLAGRAAADGKLPVGTPLSVERFLQAKGPLSGENWLWFDESAKESALHCWAQAGEHELRELSRAFLLREKVFQCAEIGSISIPQSIRLFRALDDKGRENIDWLLDDPTFTSYKDYDAGFRTGGRNQDKGAVSTGAILISSGEINEAARPAEAVSRVLESLGENPQGSRHSLCRLYFHSRIAEQVRKVLAEHGLPAP